MSKAGFPSRGPGGRRTRRPPVPPEPPRRDQRIMRGRWMLVLAALALIVFAILVLPGGEEAQPPATPPADLIAVPEATIVQVVEVLDGHTMDVRAGGSTFRIRIFGIVAPKRGEACEDEARERLEELAGRRVQLASDERLEDEHGRQLRYVYTMGGESVDAILIIEGLAEAWRRDGALRDTLVAYEEQARAQGTGCLWARR